MVHLLSLTARRNLKGEIGFILAPHTKILLEIAGPLQNAKSYLYISGNKLKFYEIIKKR